MEKAGLKEHDLRFTSTFICRSEQSVNSEQLGERLAELCRQQFPEAAGAVSDGGSFVLCDSVTVLTKERDAESSEFDVHVTYSFEVRPEWLMKSTKFSSNTWSSTDIILGTHL